MIAAWLQQMQERKIDGGKLVAAARALVAKYANEPEPQPEPKIAAQPEQPPPVKAATPKVETPAAAPAAKIAPAAKPVPPKELDIPL